MVCPIQFQPDTKLPSKRVLIICCEMCPIQERSKGNIAVNTFCRQQVLKILPFIEGNVPIRFNAVDQSIFLSIRGFDLLKEYVDVVNRFQEASDQNTPFDSELRIQLFSNPIHALRLIEKKLRFNKSRHLHEFYSALKNTKLLRSAQTLPKNPSLDSQSAIYETLLHIHKLPRSGSKIQKAVKPTQLLDTYQVGPFKIKINEIQERSFERFYQVTADLTESISMQIVRFLASKPNFGPDEIELMNLNSVINRHIHGFQNYLSSNFYELSGVEQKDLAIYATAQLLDLPKTMPLLLDDNVQEFFLDKPGEAYYLDHANWGRCRTNLSPTQSELTRLITRLRLESRRPLDENSPSLKTELNTELFHVRAAVDIPPLAHDGLHLNFRKLRIRLLTLPELIQLSTISLEAAAFLILCMTLRQNITICGEPASGKTTLANAINLLAPLNWRQIAIEDALESFSLNFSEGHNVTFKVDPFDSVEEQRHTKSNEIIRLLHRSPDWVFLGEIQTAEHSEAMFHAISAGIRGIQTCHANSNEDLLLRWSIHHKIPEVCFRGLGVLVHMIKEISDGRFIRRVVQISEINLQSPKPSLLTLFEWNKSTGHLEHVYREIITPLISRASKVIRQTDTEIQFSFETIKAALNRLVQDQVYNPSEIIKIFHEAQDRISPKSNGYAKKEIKAFQPGGEILRLSKTNK